MAPAFPDSALTARILEGLDSRCDENLAVVIIR